MAVLTAPRLLPQQRFDLEDLELLLLALQTDAQIHTREFWNSTGMILKGFSVSGLGGPGPALVSVAGATLINPDNTDCFSWFTGATGASPLQAPLTPSARNYIEIELSREDGTPLTRAFWDPSAQGGLGAEFNQTTNTVTTIEANVVVLTGGFSGNPNRLPIAYVDTDGSNNIKLIKDKRNMLFRLGTPANPLATYTWGSQLEPQFTINMTGVTGTFTAGELLNIGGVAQAEVQVGGTTTIGVILPSNDLIVTGQLVIGLSSGATGTISSAADTFSGADKSIDNLREAFSAITSQIKAMQGTRFWFEVANGSINGINSFINTTLAPFTSTSRIKWDGSNIYFLDAALSPLKADVVAKVRIFNRNRQYNLTRQDDGKEIQTVAFDLVPDSGAYVLQHNGQNSNSISWSDNAAAVQAACNANWTAQVTVTGNVSNGFKFVFNTAGPVPQIVVQSNTLKQGVDNVTVTPSTIKNGLAGIAPIAIADGQVLYLEIPAGTDRTFSDAGSGTTNYRVAALGSFVNNDLNYWIAYREGGRLIVRGIGEVTVGEEVAFASGVPQTLLDILGLATAMTAPTYSSTIRGTQSENFVKRMSILTDAMGDSQEDRSAYLRSDVPVTWTGTQVQFTSDVILEILNTKTGVLSQHTILTANSPIALANGESIYVKVDREQTSENLTLINSGVTPIPAQTQGNKDVFVLFRRVDALTAGYLHIPLHKQVLEPGQTVRLGASGSGDGTGGGDLAPIPGYRWREDDTFDVLSSSSDAKVTTTGYTNATQSLAKKLYRILCDKSKTVATSSGTGLTISGAPTFTVAAGDIVYATNGPRAGQWRRIATVNSQTDYVLDAAFTGGDASAGNTLMVSQAVWTADLVNLGSASEKTRARDFWSGDITQIAVDYEDSLVVDDDIPDFVDTARVVMGASNSGVLADTGVPLSSTFGNQIFTRAAAPATIDNFTLSTNANQQRLFLCFFCNPSNGSVTSTANLLSYQANFFADDSLTNSGVLNDALCFSDGSTTEVNCTVATPAGLTQVDLTWTYTPNVNPGGPTGQVRVYVNGGEVSRYIGTGETPSTDLFYTEQPDSNGLYRRIQFTKDLSGTPVEIRIVRQFGVYDLSTQNTARIMAEYDAIVGTADQVAAGIATHTTLQAAVNAVFSGAKIGVRNNVLIMGNTTLNFRMMIVGMGPGSLINGDLTIASGAAGSIVKEIRFDGNISLLAGADDCYLTHMYVSPGRTVSDDPTNLNNTVDVKVR